MNGVKTASALDGGDAYRVRKAEVYTRALAWLGEDEVGLDWFDFWETYRPESGTRVSVTLRHPDGREQRLQGRYRERAAPLAGEDGEVHLLSGEVVSSDTAVRVIAWAFADGTST